MSGFWRKILDKKANATHTPQPGDWAAMQSMLDESPVLGKPAAGGNGAAGSSSLFGGSAIIKGIVAVLVSLSAYTAYVVLSEGEIDAEDSYYYQARIESENSSDVNAVSLDNQDQNLASENTTEKLSETTDIVESRSGIGLSRQSSNATMTSAENVIEPFTDSQRASDVAASDKVKATDKFSDQVSLIDRPSQLEHISDPENADAGSAIADSVPAGQDQDSETKAITSLTGSASIQINAAQSSSSDTPDPKAAKKLSAMPDEQDGTTLQQPTSVTDSEGALPMNISATHGESSDEEYDEEEEDESDVILDALKRMKFNSVAACLSYSSLNTTPDFFAPGAAVELEWRLSQWRLQTGLSYQSWYESGRTKGQEFSYVDTNYSFTTVRREVDWVDSSWVVTGINQGEYVYDTSSAVITDTVYNLSLDTMHIYTEHPLPASFMSSRFSIPIRISYRKRFGSFYGDLGTALISNFTTYQSGYVGDAQKTSFSFDLALRPALGFQINRQWSTELGFNYNMPLYQGVADEMIFDRGHYWSLSVGIRYFLDN